jgi:hypothetical protein
MVLLGLDALYMEKCGRWRLRGLRPAGHPYRRLAQYLELNRRQPDWRERVRHWGTELEQSILTSHRRRLHDGILGCVFPDGRADTLCINALLPLLHASGEDCERTWIEWPPGNHPEDIEEARRVLGLTGVSRNFEVQGILDVIRRSAPDATPA